MMELSGGVRGRLSRHLSRFARPSIRPLTVEDTEGLQDILRSAPVAHLFALEQYHRVGLPTPSLLTRARGSSPFIGIFDPTAGAPRLAGALWFGSNLVPLRVPSAHRSAAAGYILATGREISSIFGLSEEVLSLWEHLRGDCPVPFDLRPEQPLLELGGSAGARHRSTLQLLGRMIHQGRVPLREAGIGSVRWARPAETGVYQRAAAAMFTEEVGYSPMTRDPEGYARRVAEGIRQGRCLLALSETGEVVFKTDLGLRAESSCQLQGVWLHPRLRGRGLAAPLLAQACRLITARDQRVSLYVNAYNSPARALYRRLGFEQVGTFATVLF